MEITRRQLQYLIKEMISVPPKYLKVENIPLISRLMKKATAHYTSYDGTILKFMQSDGCATLLDIRLSDDPNRPDALYVEQIEVLKYPYGELDQACFGEGYAKEVLALLAQEADATGTELYLVASPTTSGKERAYFELPDKDQLAALYSRYGFTEDFRNAAQIGMSRQPFVT